MNTYARLPVRLVRGEGPWLFDEGGRRFLDTVTGIGVCSLGHAHPAVTAAIREQAGLLLHAANIAELPVQEQLAARLALISGLDQAFFCNSGAEALECAFKLARLHGAARDIETPQIVVVTRSFHGRTLACLSATDSAKVQSGFAPLMPGFIRVPFDDAGAVARLAEERDDIAAVLCEPILGEGGVVLPQDGYLAELRRICDQHDWLLMTDEVQTGIGKTGRWFAYQHAGIIPDVVAVAKALGNGVPIGACLARRRVGELFSPGRHGSTYGGNPLACRAALAVLETIEQEQLLDHCAAMGRRLSEALAARLQGLETVRQIRGRGLMIGIELAAPCGTLRDAALDQGLLLNITRDTTIRLLPPLTIDTTICDRIAAQLAGLIGDWHASCKGFPRTQQGVYE